MELSIEKTSCELIIQEIDKKGFASVAELQIMDI